MGVLSETQLCTFIGRVLTLSREVLEVLPDRGTQEVGEELLDRYTLLVNDLNAERSNDSLLNDESWNWIWESKSSFNHIRLYGRLAWINLQLLELL